MIKEFLFVGLGGAVGSMLRYGVTLLMRTLSMSANWGTFLVNIVGSLLIGFCMGLCDKGTLFLFLTVGICGGFTTFSTFSSQTLSLLQSGRYGTTALYVFGTLLIGLLFVFIGVWAGAKLR
ncbi:MAG: fluoride efflux transporter CrcB [Bacteroidales bacterium]|nr:fluoride efflux transporter CrcB [Bacteroidales bacterium]